MIASLIALFFLSFQGAANAYPVFAQKAYQMPREATGRIVCANCHLAAKPVAIELPQSIFPGQIFGVHVEIPIPDAKQVLGDGKKGSLNIGGAVILPDGFKLASRASLPPELKKETKGIFFQPYSEDQQNILVFGPMAPREVTVPIQAPKEGASFGSYPIYFGGNRGRGQIYPNGEKSNNTVYTSPVKGVIQAITEDSISILGNDGTTKSVSIPKGPEIIVKVNDSVIADEPLTTNPNVGGFGQVQGEFIYQAPSRLLSLQAFLWAVFIAQVFLVLKKKQIEVVV